MPDTLSLTQRKGQLHGQATRFVVPVLGFDPVQQALVAGELPTSAPALPSGYTPIAAANGEGTSLEEGLRDAETQVLTLKPRVPLPEDDEILDQDPGAPPSPPAASSDSAAAPAPQDTPSHENNIAALNALVGQLRKADTITTRQLWVRLARMRQVKVDEMVELLNGPDDSGELHWGPLRDSLDEEEAAELRRRLGRLYAEQQEVLPV